MHAGQTVVLDHWGGDHLEYLVDLCEHCWLGRYRRNQAHRFTDYELVEPGDVRYRHRMARQRTKPTEMNPRASSDSFPE